MSIEVTVVVGNPKRKSRTREVAEKVVEKLLQRKSYTCTVIDLADYAEEIFQWPSGRLDALNKEVADSDLAVIASPTYKATYTGLLKAFLDRYPSNGLAGVPVIAVHTGADRNHSMAPTFTLAPLLLELGAIVSGRGFYVPTSELDRLDALIEEMVAECADNIARLARLSSVCQPSAIRGAERAG